MLEEMRDLRSLRFLFERIAVIVLAAMSCKVREKLEQTSRYVRGMFRGIPIGIRHLHNKFHSVFVIEQNFNNLQWLHLPFQKMKAMATRSAFHSVRNEVVEPTS